MRHDYKQRLRALLTTDREPIKAELPKRGGDDAVATFRLYDPIDSWGGDFGVSAKEFTAALDDLPDTVNEIRLHINSPGGEVFEGIAVLNALRAHDARVVAVVEGVAASAASFIACGADEVIMARNSELMIHDAWGLCVGNAEDMRELADDLDRLSDNIASVYAEKAGGDLEAWRAAMRRESWYSAEEAVEAGLADRVETRKASQPKDKFDLSIFTYAGRTEAPEPTEHRATFTADEVRESFGMTTPPSDPTPPDDAHATPPEDADEERERQAQRVRAWELTA